METLVLLQAYSRKPFSAICIENQLWGILEHQGTMLSLTLSWFMVRI